MVKKNWNIRLGLVAVLTSLLVIIWATITPISALQSEVDPDNEFLTTEQIYITSVDQLKDVQPTDWAFMAVQSLADRGMPIAYPDLTFRGNRVATRGELAQWFEGFIRRVLETSEPGDTQSDLPTQEDLERLAQSIQSLQQSIGELQQGTPQPNLPPL